MRKWYVCVKCFREDWKPKRNRRNRDMCPECYGEWLKQKYSDKDKYVQKEG